MATKFRIRIHRNGGDVHLKVIGYFDGSAACELINTLKVLNIEAVKIFIHTNNLKSVHPFGREVFHKKYPDFRTRPHCLIFTGKHRKEIALPKSNSSL